MSSNQLISLPDETSQLKLAYLDLSTNPLVNLPALNIRFSLNLAFTNITELPDTNPQNLNLSRTKIQSLPSTIVKMDAIENLDLSFTPLTSIHSEIDQLLNLHTLNLSFTQLSSLPSDIQMPQSLELLDLSGTMITSLPEGLIFSGNLVLNDTRIEDSFNLQAPANGVLQQNIQAANISMNGYFLQRDDNSIWQIWYLDHETLIYEQVTFSAYDVQEFDVTPHGDIIYVANTGLWYWPIGTRNIESPRLLDTLTIPSADFCIRRTSMGQIAFSPDGSDIAYVDNGDLYIITTEGDIQSYSQKNSISGGGGTVANTGVFFGYQLVHYSPYNPDVLLLEYYEWEGRAHVPLHVTNNNIPPFDGIRGGNCLKTKAISYNQFVTFGFSSYTQPNLSIYSTSFEANNLDFEHTLDIMLPYRFTDVRDVEKIDEHTLRMIIAHYNPELEIADYELAIYDLNLDSFEVTLIGNIEAFHENDDTLKLHVARDSYELSQDGEFIVGHTLEDSEDGVLFFYSIEQSQVTHIIQDNIQNFRWTKYSR